MVPESEASKVDSPTAFQHDLLNQRFFEDAPLGMAVTATDGTWQRINPALAAMLGYSVQELEGSSLVGLTHPDDVADVHEAIRCLVAGESKTYELEKRLRAKDGSYRWLSVTRTLPCDIVGVATQFTTYFLDIAERRRREAAMRASEARYRRLFECAYDGILILDEGTERIIDANPFMTALTGFTRDELVGRTLWDIGFSGDSAAAKAAFAELQAKNYVRYEDLPLKTREGCEVAVECVSNVYLVDDRKFIQCNVRDISQRKLAAEALHLRDRAIEAVAQGITIANAQEPDLPIVYASPGFMQLTGYAREDILGRNCRFMQGVGTDQDEVAKLRLATQQGEACSVELVNYRKDGSAFWNSVSLSPVQDGNGRVTHFVGVQTDVTERRQLEDQLRQAQKMEAVGLLAGGVAHDFNNALSVIVGYAELVCGDLTLDAPIRADVDEIRKAGLRAAELTRQLLAFSRQQVLESKVLSLNQSIAGMEKMLQRLVGADIELVTLPAGALGSVKADPGQVEQILMNLVVNARDAMPHGGKLTIETANVELDKDYARIHVDVKPGPYVMLTVADSGVGMAPETVKRIFEPFFTTKELGKGTGLGLAMVFGIVKQSDGHIVVVSEPGAGTTFTVYFPRVDGADEEAVTALPVLDSERHTGTILLVEDEDQVRILARNILRRQGYVVLEAPNGGEALLICEQHAGPIDVLLTDVVLPRMSGRVLAERITAARPEIAVLYMSGYTDDAILHHGIIDLGFAFLQKPFTPLAMTNKVAEVLRIKRAVAGV